MKVALYIENGLEQVVLTPETDLEKMCVEKLSKHQNFKSYRGGFYACQGGWTRMNQYENEADSTIFVIEEKK